MKPAASSAARARGSISLPSCQLEVPALSTATDVGERPAVGEPCGARTGRGGPPRPSGSGRCSRCRPRARRAGPRRGVLAAAGRVGHHGGSEEVRCPTPSTRAARRADSTAVRSRRGRGDPARLVRDQQLAARGDSLLGDLGARAAHDRHRRVRRARRVRGVAHDGVPAPARGSSSARSGGPGRADAPADPGHRREPGDHEQDGDDRAEERVGPEHEHQPADDDAEPRERMRTWRPSPRPWCPRTRASSSCARRARRRRRGPPSRRRARRRRGGRGRASRGRSATGSPPPGSPMITTARSSQRSHEVSVEKTAFATSGGVGEWVMAYCLPIDRSASMTMHEHATPTPSHSPDRRRFGRRGSRRSRGPGGDPQDHGASWRCGSRSAPP